MKNKRFITLFVAILFAVSGCNKNTVNENPTNENPTNTANAVIESPANTSATESQIINDSIEYGDISNIRMSYVSDVDLKDYSSFHEYGKGYQNIILSTDKVIKDFSFIEVGLNDSFNCYSKGDLYLIGEFQPEKPLIVKIDIPEGGPGFGITFIDTNNERKYFFISESGMDGSLSLVEFENNKKI